MKVFEWFFSSRDHTEEGMVNLSFEYIFPFATQKKDAIYCTESGALIKS